MGWMKRVAVSRFRPIMAWLLACEVAGMCLYLILLLPWFVQDGLPDHLKGVGGLAIAVLPFFSLGGLVASMTFWAAPPLVWGTRLFELPRPFADVVIGSIPAGVALTASIWPRGEYSVQPAGGEIQIMIALLISGGVAGFTYWLAAGRPRPPY